MKWKQYSNTINIDTNFPGTQSVYALMKEKKKEFIECLRHDLNQLLFDSNLRRYRRGKNRCHRCGWKI